MFFFYFFWRLTWASMVNNKKRDILETVDRKVKRSRIWASRVNICCIHGTFDCFCSGSVWGHSVHCRFLTTLYLENHWSWYRKKGPKFGSLGQIFSVYRVLLTVKCSSSVWSFGAFPIFFTTLYPENGLS